MFEGKVLVVIERVAQRGNRTRVKTRFDVTCKRGEFLEREGVCSKHATQVMLDTFYPGFSDSTKMPSGGRYEVQRNVIGRN